MVCLKPAKPQGNHGTWSTKGNRKERRQKKPHESSGFKLVKTVAKRLHEKVSLEKGRYFAIFPLSLLY